VKLPDGRLVCTYAVRSKPFGIRARVSDDNGRTWGPEMTLRDDSRTWDIGYCQSAVRSDGKIVTVYYYATEKHFENHIAATIWQP
jgi:Neuraminidase (sialidase)